METTFEDLKGCSSRLAQEAQDLARALEEEFDEESDPESVNARLALKLMLIRREMERIKEIRGDELAW